MPRINATARLEKEIEYDQNSFTFNGGRKMNAPMFTAGLLALMTLLFAGGGLLLKRFAEGHGWWWFVASAGVYLVGNLTYSRLLAQNPIGVATTLSSCAQIIILCIAGRVVFSDTLTLTQWAGVGAAILGLILVTQSSAT